MSGKEGIVSYFKAVSQQLSVEIKYNQETPQSI
jgi:hypothetical protein